MQYSRALMVGVLSLVAAVAIASQSAARFEVVSVRPSEANSRASSIRALPGGRLQVINFRLRDLIRVAYGLEPYQALEGTFPVLDHRFDIIAKTASDAELVQTNDSLALQQLLAERFQLRVHTKRSQVTGYAIRLARKDGRLGQQLQPSTLDCRDLRARGLALPRNDEGNNACALWAGNSNGVLGIRARGGSHTIAEFAAFLTKLVGAPIQDETGLEGRFDIDVTYGALPGALNPQPLSETVAIAPDLDIALQEQLGLTLSRRELPFDGLVIEHVEKPSEN